MSSEPAILGRCLIVIFLGLAFGLLSGFAGMAIQHHCETTFAAEQSGDRHLLELLTLPALPGSLIAERRSGSGDWQVGEAWSFRWQASGWNALVWSVIAAGLCPFVALWMAASRPTKR